MKVVLLLSTLLICLSAVGCSSTHEQNARSIDYNELLHDGYFPSHTRFTVESEKEVFSLDAEMKAFVLKNLRNVPDAEQRTKKLVKYLFSREHIDISYQVDANLTASQAFRSQAANCLSLTIMAYSLAKYAELDATFKEVDIPEYWTRNGEYNTLSGHVNLEIKEKRQPNVPVILAQRATRIDFDPSVASNGFSSFDISKTRILAMFYNNKAANSIVSGDYDVAYAYLKASIKTDPSFSASWGNLGVLYRLNSLFYEAKTAYQYAVYLDEDNFTANRNFALTLALLGDKERASEIISAIHRKRLKNPYYLVMLGDEAFHAGKLQTAIAYYRKAIKLEPKVHETYFGLAKVYFAMDDLNLAEKSLQKAIRFSNLEFVDEQYTAKLNLIRSRR